MDCVVQEKTPLSEIRQISLDFVNKTVEGVLLCPPSPRRFIGGFMFIRSRYYTECLKSLTRVLCDQITFRNLVPGSPSAGNTANRYEVLHLFKLFAINTNQVTSWSCARCQIWFYTKSEDRKKPL